MIHVVPRPASVAAGRTVKAPVLPEGGRPTNLRDVCHCQPMAFRGSPVSARRAVCETQKSLLL